MTTEFKSAKFYRYQLNVANNERLRLELEKENSDKEPNANAPNETETKVTELLATIYRQIEKAPFGFVFFEFPVEYSDLYGRDDDHSFFLQSVLDRVIARLKNKGFSIDSPMDGIIEISF